MQRLHQYALAHPRTVLVIAAVVLGVSAAGLPGLRLRTDGRALAPLQHPALERDRQIRSDFHLRDLLVVVITSTHADGVFNAGTLGVIEALTAELQAMPGIEAHDVSSLATEASHRVKPGTLEPRTLLDPLPVTAEQIAALRSELARIALHDGTIVASDGGAAAILVGVPETLDRVAFYRDVRRLVRPYQTEHDIVRVIGAPVAEALLGLHILEDLGAPRTWLGLDPRETVGSADGAGGLRPAIARYIGLLPLAIAVMALVFFLAFGTVYAALLPLMEVGACLLTVFGVMGWFGVPVYLTIAVMPVILTAVGTADEVHLFWRYRRKLAACESNATTGTSPEERAAALPAETAEARPAATAEARPSVDADALPAATAASPPETEAALPPATEAALPAAMREIAPAIVATSLTTAVAFLSFALSSQRPVQVFGIFTAIGVMFCMVWSLTVIPALLILLGPRAAARAARRELTLRPSAASPRDGGLARVSLKAICNKLETRARPPKPDPPQPCPPRPDPPQPFSPLPRPSQDAPPKPARDTILQRWGAIIARRPVTALVIIVLILAVLLPGIGRLRVQDSWIDGFARTSVFHEATRQFNDRFLGTHMLAIHVTAPRVEMRGEVTGSAVADYRIVLQDQPLDPAADLTDAVIRLYADGGDARRPREWSAHVASVSPGDAGTIIDTDRSGGSARFALRPEPDERLRYEIRTEPFMRPQFLRRLEDLESFITAHHHLTVGGVIGPAAYLRTANYMAGGLNEARRRIPATPAEARTVWRHLARVRGAHRLRQVVDPGYSEGIVLAFLKNANYADVAALMTAIGTHAAEHLQPHGARVAFAGDVAVSQTLIEAIVQTQVRSLVASLLGILVVAVLVMRSLRLGLLCVMPCAAAVATIFAVMGWTGMPLGVATSMFAAMTLGIGVDYAIHLVTSYVHSPADQPTPERIGGAFAACGPAIVTDALAVGLGFGALVLSQVPANARLGVLLVISVGTCLVCTFVLLPAVLAILAGPRDVFRGRARPAPLPTPGSHEPGGQSAAEARVRPQQP